LTDTPMEFMSLMMVPFYIFAEAACTALTML
jgi:hypothetical protein